MKARIYLALLLASFVCMANGEVAYTLNTQFNSKQLNIQITDEELIKTPPWEESAANPPVSARRAELIARNYARSKWPVGSAIDLPREHKKEWQLDSMTLRPIREKRWIYVVQLTLTPVESPTGFYVPTHIVVLMDGSVVEPTEDRSK